MEIEHRLVAEVTTAPYEKIINIPHLVITTVLCLIYIVMHR